MRAASLLVLMAVVLLGLSTPASAADDRLGLSSDGVTWTSSLAQPLFNTDFRWVPGDVQTRSFYVRNQSGETAQLSVDVLGTTIDDLIQTGDLVVSARSDDGNWTDVSRPGRYRLIAWVPTSADQVREVEIRILFKGSSTNQSQTLASDLNLLVQLREDIPVPPTPTPDPTPTSTAGTAVVNPEVSPNGIGSLPDGWLPQTGAPTFWAGFAGLSLLISGIIVALKRRENEEEHV